MSNANDHCMFEDGAPGHCVSTSPLCPHNQEQHLRGDTPEALLSVSVEFTALPGCPEVWAGWCYRPDVDREDLVLAQRVLSGGDGRWLVRHTGYPRCFHREQCAVAGGDLARANLAALLSEVDGMRSLGDTFVWQHCLEKLDKADSLISGSDAVPADIIIDGRDTAGGRRTPPSPAEFVAVLEKLRANHPSDAISVRQMASGADTKAMWAEADALLKRYWETHGRVADHPDLTDDEASIRAAMAEDPEEAIPSERVFNRFGMSLEDLPEFVWLGTPGGVALRLTGSEYHREAGNWSLGFERGANGALRAVTDNYHLLHANGTPMVPCTEAEWRQSNGLEPVDPGKAPDEPVPGKEENGKPPF